jgi:hypothetical protein
MRAYLLERMDSDTRIGLSFVTKNAPGFGAISLLES